MYGMSVAGILGFLPARSSATVTIDPFVPKPRGSRDPRLEFSSDVLEDSRCVRETPPRRGPGVTQLVTQAVPLSTCGRAEPEGFKLGPSTGGQRLRNLIRSISHSCRSVTARSDTDALMCCANTRPRTAYDATQAMSGARRG